MNVNRVVILLTVVCFFHIYLDAVAQTVLVIRHAQKTVEKEDVHFEKWNLAESQPLSVQGWQRAYAYIPYFTMNPQMTVYGNIVGLFAPKPDNDYKSVRPIQTLTPLAQHLGIKVNCEYGLDNQSDMLAMKQHIMNDALYHNGCVLIAYEHHHIPELLKVFGVKKLLFQKWPKDVYDWVMVLEFDTKSGELTKFSKKREYLMAGDSAGPIIGGK